MWSISRQNGSSKTTDRPLQTFVLLTHTTGTAPGPKWVMGFRLPSLSLSRLLIQCSLTQPLSELLPKGRYFLPLYKISMSLHLVYLVGMPQIKQGPPGSKYLLIDTNFNYFFE